MSKVWFITGSSRGFGRRFAEAALSRGDKVAAAARDTDSLAELVAAHGDAVLPLALDVTDRTAATQAVNRAHEHFGRLDIVVNNAGYGHFGMVEEITEDDIRGQFETNVLGALWVTQAALPHLRAQAGGHIVMLSSMLGVAPFPTTGAYSASKAALEGLTESLAQEAAGFGIKVTIVEPGAFGTDFAASSAYSAPLDAYAGVRDAVNAGFADMPMPDPAGVGAALLAVVDADNPPLRVFFGSVPLQVVQPLYAERLKTWEQWAGVSAQAGAGRD
ncbi:MULTISPECIES: SDR family NAD(P)-dependent oxidoreductase [unclassified Streptomyces]|uniref:SDR family NAD(P)-dependent oxidoreductase n=1 Tax=unclassified Streptomyces TaxID=2593676 RepID=UPI0033BA7F6B